MSRIFGKKEFAIYIFVNFVVWLAATLVDGSIWFFRWLIVYGQLVSGWVSSSTERLISGTLICLISAGWALDISSRRDEPHPMRWIVIASILGALAFVQYCAVVLRWEREKHDNAVADQIC